jgi:hypothetical protein
VATVARQPYALTLWTWAHLSVALRIESLTRRADAIHAASLQAAAFHEPKRLKDASDQLNAEAGLMPSVEETVAAALGVAQDLQRLDASEATA